ncbi:type II toxin-antitoxin system HicB family antitoxin [Candidatus Acetothermia bacterium]|nr:type II toxin-antitoxin system HicB family antitoxin [Candidatus Acetothermia bacterium]MBI3643140.1 type II toxin-antitoxin system HicB family antitoxin [Candidatus Acetothermia bacterium]
MKSYTVIYEKIKGNYSAYIPDLPGCVACADTLNETEELIKEAIELYLGALRVRGQPVPEPTTTAKALSVPI